MTFDFFHFLILFKLHIHLFYTHGIDRLFHIYTRGIQMSLVDSLRDGLWCIAMMLYLLTRTSSWAKCLFADDLRQCDIHVAEIYYLPDEYPSEVLWFCVSSYLNDKYETLISVYGHMICRVYRRDRHSDIFYQGMLKKRGKQCNCIAFPCL